MKLANRTSRFAFTVAVLLGAAAPNAFAGAVLTPGTSASLTGGNYAATVVQDIDRPVTLTSGSSTLTVTVRDRVTLTGSTYNFERFILNTNTFAVGTSSFAENGFAGFTTTADYDPTTAGGTQFPTSAARSAGTGDTLTFSQFSPSSLAAAAQTDYMTIQTNAPAYAFTGSVNVTVLGVTGAPYTGSVGVFAPAIPEPASLGLMAIPAAALLLRKHR
jgi:hypothetical protein